MYACKATGELKESDFMMFTDEIDTDNLKDYGKIIFILEFWSSSLFSDTSISA